MTRTSVTAMGRTAALAGMVDACTITRLSGSSTDGETSVVTTTTSTVYTGQCKVQQAAASGSPTDIGEASLSLQQLQLHLPVTATDVRVGDIATITASALDPDLVGRKFTIRGTAHKTFLTARRFDVQEVGS